MGEKRTPGSGSAFLGKQSGEWKLSSFFELRPENWKKSLSNAGWIAGCLMGAASFCILGNPAGWLGCACIPLVLPVVFSSWKGGRIPALILMLLFGAAALMCERSEHARQVLLQEVRK